MPPDTESQPTGLRLRLAPLDFMILSRGKSECPLNGNAAAESFALSLPAIDVEIIANATILRQEAIAEFEHIARSLETRAGRSVAADARARLAAEFMLPCPSRIAFARVLVLFAVAEAETQAMRVDVSEVVGVARDGGDRDIAEVQCYSTPRPWICRL